LIEFWLEYGGGDLFEHETILSPVPVKKEGMDDMDSTNQFYYQNGLDKKYIVFQIDTTQATAFDRNTNEVVELKRNGFRVDKKFTGITQWFNYFWQIYQ